MLTTKYIPYVFNNIPKLMICLTLTFQSSYKPLLSVQHKLFTSKGHGKPQSQSNTLSIATIRIKVN